VSHGFWHSYFFVLTIYPVVLSLIVYVAEIRFEKTIFRSFRFFRFFPRKVRYSFKTIYLCCLIGGVSHIFLDMLVHENSSYVLFPFYEGNPFWIGEWSIIIHVLVSLLSLYTVFLWIRQMQVHRKTCQSTVSRSVVLKTNWWADARLPKKMIWTEKLFTRLPIDRKKIKEQMLVRLFFLFVVWLTGLAAYALDGQAAQYVSNVQVFPWFGTGLIILMGTFMIQESLGDTVLSVRPLLNMDDSKFKKLLGRIEWYSYGFLPYLLLTLVIVVLSGNIVTLVSRTLFEGFHGIWTVCFMFFSSLLTATGIWICVSIWLTTYLISRQPIQVELSPETMKKFRGLAVLALQFAAFYFLAVSLGVVLPLSQTPIRSFTDVIMSPILPFTVIGLVGVLLPFYNIHTALLSLKKQELSKIQSEFERLEITLDEILTKPTDQLSDQTTDITYRIFRLQIKERRIKAAQEWPIDITFISKLLGLVLTPVVAKILTELL